MKKICTPEISIIIPVYNVRGYIDKCLDSLINQTFDSFEVLLIDDGSTDGSSDLVDEWGSLDSRIKPFHKANGGLSSARNYGLDRATGRYITCIDSDDYVATTYLEQLYRALLRHPDCSFSSCNFYVVSERNTSLIATSEVSETVLSQYDAFENVLYHGFLNVSAWGKLYKKELFDSLRYPEGHLYEDTYVFGELLLKSNRVAYINDPIYYYIKRKGSIVSGAYNSSRLEFIESVDKLIKCAQICSKDLNQACIRRWVHARLSVLRYMGSCKSDDELAIREKFRQECLLNKSAIMRDSKAPLRDKAALLLLTLGFRPFISAWDFREKLSN
jgi:glycosyltransferase involved in cell wall biosynthesis